MATTRKILPTIDRDTGIFGAASINTAAGAANDQVSQAELEQLDSSAGSYERIRRIRSNLRRSDIWFAVGIYAVLAVSAYFII